MAVDPGNVGIRLAIPAFDKGCHRSLRPVLWSDTSSIDGPSNLGDELEDIASRRSSWGLYAGNNFLALDRRDGREKFSN
jgi:hypothetical protein